MNIDVIGNRRLFFTISGILLLASFLFIIQSLFSLGSPVRLGLDFTGGSKLEYKFQGKQLQESSKALGSEDLLAFLEAQGLKNSSVQISRDEDPVLILRTKAVSDDPALEGFNEQLEKNYGLFEILSIDTVSPIIGPELFNSGLVALLFTIIGIVIYISSRFKKDYAACAIFALIHDVFIVVGLFAFLGLYYNVEVDSLFITALLTVFGFSVHDTIVVFDRIRENQKLETKNFSFDKVVNLSVQQVAIRSLNTSITTLMVLGILLFFGGASTKLFVGAMFIGLLAGTYSSIFLASPLLVYLRDKKILTN
jgi:preprotein translocase subunit SecF